MTAIGSTAITYDALGNPLTYGSTTYTWQNGRQLASISMNYGAMVYSFEYNDSGIRTSKTVNGVKHTYTLNGSQIVTESWTQSGVEYFIVYLYDESGAPIGMQYRTSNYAYGEFDNYFFEKNLFGDVVAIYNEAGTKIGSYMYDAWGACTAVPGVGTTYVERNILNNLNPFRYRGYYYDTETGLYYLQSRYYNPIWGRFLNADGYINANGDLIGFNMYAYCSNNPVMYTDPTGESGLAIIGLVTVGIILLFALTSDSNQEPSYQKYATEKYNSDTINVYMENEGAPQDDKINAKFYTNNEKTYTNISIDNSLNIRSKYEMNAVLNVIMESEYYTEEKFGTQAFMRSQWLAHNWCYDIASSGKVGFKLMQIVSGSDNPIESAQSLDLRSNGNMLKRQKILYTIISWVIE